MFAGNVSKIEVTMDSGLLDGYPNSMWYLISKTLGDEIPHRFSNYTGGRIANASFRNVACVVTRFNATAMKCKAKILSPLLLAENFDFKSLGIRLVRSKLQSASWKAT